jgi:hypothetical protein
LLESKFRESNDAITLQNFHLFQLEEEKFKNNMFNNKQTLASANSVTSSQYLVTFFLTNILRMTINNHINRFSFNIKAEIDLGEKFVNALDIESLLEYMESNNIENTVNIRLQYSALLSNLQPENNDYYLNFKNLLYRNIKNLSKAEASTLFGPLESVIAQKINSGRTEFYNDIFETYVVELDNGIYTSGSTSTITALKFRNIYLCAIRLGKFEWAENFINEYKARLQKEDRQSIFELALARLNFEKKDFDKTLLHLHKVKTGQIFYKIDVKILNLMAFYELSHFESSLSLIESFRRMLNSNTSFTDQYREKNVNFINILNSLIKIRLDDDKEALLKLKVKLGSIDSLANRKWLTTKIDENKMN